MKEPDAELLRLLVENVTDYAIFVLDTEGRVASWNPGAARIKGYAAEEIVGRHFSAFYPQEALDRGWPAYELDVAQAQGRFEDEGWRLRKDGSRFWANVVITALRDEAGELRGFAKITRDLTARRDAEANARRLAEESAARQVASEERERLRVTLASIGDAVISTDARGRVEFLNPIAERLVGWTADEAAGRSLDEVFCIVNEETRRPVANPAMRALEEGVIVGLANHTVLISRGGVEYPIDDSAAPIRSDRGAVTGSVLVFRDISDRKRTERHRNARLAVTQALSVAGTTAEGAAGVVDAVCKHLGWDAGYLWLVDEEARVLVCLAGRSARPASTPALDRTSLAGSFRMGEGLPGEVWATGQPAYRPDVARDPSFRRMAAAAADDLHAACAYPVTVEQRVIGVIELFSRHHAPAGPDVLETMGTTTGTLGQFLHRRRAEERLREQATNAETLLRVSRLLGEELDLHRLVQTVTDESTRLCGAGFGAFFYNVLSERGEAYTLYTLSGASREAFAGFPMPRNTAVFGPTFRGEGVVRVDDVTQDPRYGRSAPYHGMPAGHLPVRSYLAVPVSSRTGEVLGGLFFGHPEPGVFTASHERLLVGIAGQAAVAIDNARLHQRTQATAARLNLALAAAHLGDWSWDAASDVVTFSERAAEVFGIPAGPHMTWTDMQALLHADDQDRARREVERVVVEKAQYDIEYRVLRPDGSQVWVGVLGRAVYDATDQVVGMYGVVEDISERKRAEAERARNEAVGEAQRRALELLVHGNALPEVLDALCEVIETQAGDGLIATVLLVDDDGEHLRSVAGGRAPPDYARAIDGVAIGPAVGSCGTAAFRGEPVIVTDIASDPLWTDFRDLALGHGLRACWSTPIRSARGTVRGTFAVYYATPRGPSDEERRLVEILASTASLAIERRRDEAALRASETRFRGLMEQAPFSVQVLSPDGRTIEVNRAWQELWGLTIDQLEGYNLLEDRQLEAAGALHLIRRAFAGEPAFVPPVRYDPNDTLPERTRHADPVRWVGAVAYPLKDDVGAVREVVLVHDDVTARRNAEAALRDSEERLRLALEAGRMGVWDWNVRTDELQWSDSLEPLHGLAPGTFGGTLQHFRELIHPDDRLAVNAAIERALRGDDEFYVEFRNPRPGGATHWIAGSGKVFRGDDGEPLRMIGIGLDVTERKRAEQTARFLADASAALSALVDLDSTLQKVASLAVPHFADWASVDVLTQQGTLRRVGVAHVDPAKLALAHELHRRFPPDPNAASGVWNIIRTGQPEMVPAITDEVLAAAISDHELLGIMRALTLRSYIGVPLVVRGRTMGVLTFIIAESGRAYDATDLAVATDLAHRAAIAVENAQLYRELRDADQRKDEFLATLAHELRNPLAPIQNGLQVLRLAGGGGERVERARAMMERQLVHMVRLVDDLMDVSRITRNKLELRKERVSLPAVINTAIETSRPLIEKAGHTFSTHLTPTPIELEADPVRLAQVFSNLLNNAAKYTEPGGTITLTAEARGGDAVVRIRDTGLGIPAEALPRIFDMFSQVDRNMERAQGGLGIGLTLVRRLTELHGGDVAVASEGPGRGSEFTVRIPLPANAAPTVQGDGGTAEVAGAKRRILVVDDNRDAADTLGMLLEFWGSEVRTAHDGLAAVELAEQYRPDLIFLDIGLPTIDGYEVCRRIRSQTGAKHAVIVALTGWGQEEDRRRSEEAGFDHHFVKPVEAAYLTKLLASLER